MPNFTAPSRLVVTGRLMLPTGEHWLVERSGDPNPTGTAFRWRVGQGPVHTAEIVRPIGNSLARREIEIDAFGPLVDPSYLPILD